MATPSVSNTWSSGEVLTAADLNENFSDIIAFITSGGIEKDHISDKYTTTCMTVSLDTLASGSTVEMKIETEAALTPTKLTLHAATVAGGATLELTLKDDEGDISSGTLDVTDDSVNRVTSFIGGTVAGDSTLVFEFEVTGGGSASDITACLWCKTELRA